MNERKLRVDLGAQEQKRPEFLVRNVFGKVPVIAEDLGIERVSDIPKPHNLSRFLDVLGQPDPKNPFL